MVKGVRVSTLLAVIGMEEGSRIDRILIMREKENKVTEVLIQAG